MNYLGNKYNYAGPAQPPSDPKEPGRKLVICVLLLGIVVMLLIVNKFAPLPPQISAPSTLTPSTR